MNVTATGGSESSSSFSPSKSLPISLDDLIRKVYAVANITNFEEWLKLNNMSGPDTGMYTQRGDFAVFVVMKRPTTAIQINDWMEKVQKKSYDLVKTHKAAGGDQSISPLIQAWVSDPLKPTVLYLSGFAGVESLPLVVGTIRQKAVEVIQDHLRSREGVIGIEELLIRVEDMNQFPVVLLKLIGLFTGMFLEMSDLSTPDLTLAVKKTMVIK